ncbi:MAG: menaquinone biosynthesis protein [Deltaproteobacteria bacterium]
MLRIGRIEYANCTPIFHALQKYFPCEEYTFVTGVPAFLNALLASWDIDVCPSSSIEYAIHPDRYLILPNLSISSSGPVASVLLFSAVPIGDLDGRDVLLSSESATSANLLKILLKHCYGCECAFRKTDKTVVDALQEAPAVLLIGDAALRSQNESGATHVYDLGKLWYDWTGKPFVFALWLASRKAYDTNGSELQRLAGELRQAKDLALADIEHIADASSDTDWMGRARLLDYWRKNLSYNLGREHHEGVNLFFSLAEGMGLIEKAPELVFLTD